MLSQQSYHIFKSMLCVKVSYRNNNTDVKLSFIQQNASELILTMFIDIHTHNITLKVLSTLHYKLLPLYSGN